MSNVEKESVWSFGVWTEIVDGVKRECEFDDAEVAGEVSAVTTDGVEDSFANFGSEGFKICDIEPLEICG
jgi:hypothetical protein